MEAQGNGVIVNMSSGAANSALEGWSHYCASKAAVKKLTECAHKEMEDKGVRIVGLSQLKLPQDLSQHRCLTFPYSSFRSQWRFSKKDRKVLVPIEPFIIISNPIALSTCVQSGMGYGLLADWLVNDDIKNGNLVEVLPSWNASGADFEQDTALWVVMPSRQFVPLKTNVFVGFLEGLI